MPIYEFVCEKCAASRDVIVDRNTRAGLKLLCVHCGGAMTANEISRFNLRVAVTASGNASRNPREAKSCGHTHACRCSVKMTKPNPFQAEIDSALGSTDHEPH